MSNFPTCEKCGNADQTIQGNLCGYCQSTYPELIDCYVCHECGDFKRADGFTPDSIAKPRDRRQCNDCLDSWDEAYAAHQRGDLPNYDELDEISLDEEPVGTVKNRRPVSHLGSPV